MTWQEQYGDNIGISTDKKMQLPQLFECLPLALYESYATPRPIQVTLSNMTAND